MLYPLSIYCSGKKAPIISSFPLAPLLYDIIEKGEIFNWANILSHNLIKYLSKVKFFELDSPLEFYMSSYFMDIICMDSEFRGMDWFWTPAKPLVHVYCYHLWKHKYISNFTQILIHFPPICRSFSFVGLHLC